MGTFSSDLRYGFRMLVKNPGFTAVVVITLALGIGLNTAIFSLINTVLFRPLPFDQAERLVEVHRNAWDDFFSYPDYLEYRDRSDVFSALACWSYTPLSVGRGEATELRVGQIVTGNYFAALGVEAGCGRLLSPEDDVTAGAHPVAVLSHAYWQRTYGGKPQAVGNTITLNAQPFRIVGVAPEGFVGAFPIFTPDVWVPMMMQAQVFPLGGRLENRNSGWLHVVGRLKPGVRMQQAQARLDQVAAHLKDVDPERYEDEHARLVLPSGIGLPPEARPIVVGLSALVMSMVGLVLLIACANVANLLLARSTARRGEIAVRLALGAGRLRLVRQLLTESTLLALLGGAVGVLIASWVMSVVSVLLPQLPYNLSLSMDFGLDGRVLAFAALASVFTGVVFGLVPALQATNANVFPALKDNVGARGLGVRRSRLRTTLIVGQIAVSLVLLIGAGLFVRSLLSAKAINPGFDHENVLTVSLAFAVHERDAEAGKAFYKQLLDRVRVMPGVESASLDECIPLGFSQNTGEYWIGGRPPAPGPDGRADVDSVLMSIVSAGDFKTLGIPLLRGRDFNEHDTEDAPGVVIVNQVFADRNWPDEDPLGKRISLEGLEGPYREVVGVVSTVKYVFIGEGPRPFLYRPFTQNYDSNVNLLIRTTGDPMTLLPPVRAAIRELDPDVAPSDTRVLTDWIGFALLPAKFAAALFGLFGALAILLASVGLYGVMSYSVGQRTREIGIRMALGAGRRDVLHVVLRQGLTLTVVGLAIGLLVSLAGTRVLSMLLYDISATDPLTFGGVSVVLVAVAMLACYIPARRATKVDPMVALRYE
ncbi:MAG: ABC transporter permease [Phycisphaerales bacterium]|nr:MAG: ABC transporter permease [Phycisphaerales bacterium]